MSFSLTHRFAVFSLLCILAVSIVSAVMLSRFLVEQTLHRDGEMTMQFVQSLLPAREATAYFLRLPVDEESKKSLEAFFARIGAMPDVVHANVYDRNRNVLWSTKTNMIGRHLPFNPELDGALEGELEIESDLLEEREYLKPEHIYLGPSDDDFVENYVPVWDATRSQVLGVVEFYRTPRELFEMANGLVRRVWASALLGGLFLFAALFGIARGADRVIRAQQRQLVQTETLAAVGEMSAAVAHSIRNPLASIRSSAELAQDTQDPGVKDAMGDIIAQVDRIALWIKNLLTYSQPASTELKRVDVTGIIQESLGNFTREFEKRAIQVEKRLPESLPKVQGDNSLFGQVFNSLIANSVEAMPKGGTLTLHAQYQGTTKAIHIFVSDTGTGMSSEQVEKAFIPFHTSKRSGLGVGLPLVRRVVERFGGSIKIDSALGTGTRVHVNLPVR